MRTHNELARVISPNFTAAEQAKQARTLRPRVRAQAKAMARTPEAHVRALLAKPCIPTGKYVGKGADRRCVRAPATAAEVRKIMQVLGL